MIPKELKKEIDQYCSLNNIIDVDKFIIKLIKRGFTVEKFGDFPAIKKEEKSEPIIEVKLPKKVKVETKINTKEIVEPKKDIYDED